MKVQGTIIKITPLNIVSEKFKEQNVILDLQSENTQYPKILAIQFSNQGVEALLNYSEGMNVEIDCESTSREYNGRYFTTCRGWRIQGSGATMPQTQNNEPRFASQGLNEVASKYGLEETNNDDDLPF